ncbi:MAG: hypothetical protein GC161_02240 [Planctomycetaceae bacterium]|nr:hypothetical protein [Planctomycetaceae bacterium]
MDPETAPQSAPRAELRPEPRPEPRLEVSTAPVAPRDSRVLFLSRQRVEWAYVDAEGHAQRTRVAPAGSGPKDLADAAVAAQGACGVRGRRCTVLLGGDLVHERILELPPISKAQRNAVLARRADQLAGARAYFAALELPRRGDSAQSRWLLLAVVREEALALYRALEARGFDPTRAVPAALAHLDVGLSGAAPEQGPAAVVCVEPNQVVVSLLHTGGLEHQTSLPGNLVESAMLGASLIHELRSLDALWRKQNQGSSIAHVSVLGLNAHRAQALFHALASVLPGATTRKFPERAETSDAARAGLLLASAVPGPFSADLYRPAPRRMRAALVGTLLLAVAIGAGALGSEELNGQRLAVEQDSALFAEEIADLDKLRGLRSQLARIVDQVETEALLAEQARLAGVDLVTVVGDLERAFQGPFRMVEHRIDADGLRWTGRYQGNATSAARALAVIAEELSSAPWLEGLAIEPLPRVEGQEGELPFEVRARWRQRI